LAAEQAVKYLHDLGHTRIAHITGPMGGVSPAGYERFEGYRNGLNICGLPFEQNLVEHAENWSPQAGREAFERLLAKNRLSFNAIFTAADFYIMGILQTCEEKGISIPKDLSVVGFDDAQWTEFVHPGFTTFRQNKEKLGDTSAHILLDQLDGKECGGLIRIPAELITRGSCVQR
jgi:DNA-binding LacI/PurR family transcriptional regulator